ncbi:PAS domain-containing sensor histidine kinase [Paenibacillus humicola]|uniref:PAS domain-containing sensor histidine kinase n=1 Tax=Paenibacillus humicola TaxID=3110540 RepID=UPI00237BA9D0|nr:PAS domain-containing sensor histidine kinase [Paenibacillus humicola]
MSEETSDRNLVTPKREVRLIGLPNPHELEENGKTAELYRILISEHLAPAIVLNERLDICHLTGGAQELLAPADGQFGRNIRQVLEPQLADAISAVVQELRSGQPRVVRTLDGMDRLPDGLRSMQLVVKPLSSVNRQYAACTLVQFEPAELANPGAGEELQAAAEMLQLTYAMERSPSMVQICNAEGEVIFANRKYYETTGCSSDEIAGKKLSELYDWKAADLSFDDIWSRLKAGETWECEVPGFLKNGGVYWEKAKLQPIRRKGGIRSFMKLSENITERKQTEEMLRKSEMLSAIGQLAAGIAHEIRNPLTSLKGFTKLMKENNKRDYIAIMLAELERIEQIVSELLILAKPQPSEFARTCLDDVLRDVVMLLEAQAIMNDIQIELDLAGGPWHVSGIKNALKQVFINLLQNAIEAMKNGGGIRIRTELGDDGLVWTTVRDSGDGIPPEKLDNLGQPFYSTKAKGTGLGLTISGKIVDHHHGRLEFESELGRGTTARVGLPALDVSRE